MRKFKPFSVTLTDQDRRKLEMLAKINGTNCSDMVRQMIRVKRLPQLATKQKASTVLSAGPRKVGV